MNRITDHIRKWLDQPGAFVIIVGLAILARAAQLIFYLDSFFDTSFQVIATQQLVEGHGISTAHVLPGDLSHIIHQPLNNWPPGYSLLLAPFYLLFGKEYLPACGALDLLAAIAILLLSRKILRLLEIPLYLVNLFTILTSLFIYYFYYTGSTDGIAIAFYLAALVPVLRLLKNKKYKTRYVWLASLFLVFSASLKYLFFPLVFIVPVFLLIYGWQVPSAAIRRPAVIMLILVTAGVGTLYLYQQAVSGAGTYISAPGRGFFPEHLLRLHPFFPGAVITPNTVRKIPGGHSGQLMDLLRILHLIILLVLLLLALRSYRRSGFRSMSLQKVFIFLSLALSLGIVAELTALSLLVDKELIPPDRWWTYVEDARYYGLGDILVHLCLFIISYQYRNTFSGFLRISIRLLPFLLLPEAARGLLFTANRVTRLNQEKYYWKSEQSFFGFGARCAEQRLQETGTQRLVVTSSVYYGTYRASQQLTAPVLEQSTALNEPGQLKTSEPVVILAIIRNDQAPAYARFINTPGTRLAGERNGFYFYTLYVAPR